MSAIYVAASLPLKTQAQELAAVLRSAGHDVVSTWHGQSAATVEAERRLTDKERAEIAEQCRAEIRTCDVLVIILGPPTTRHGSFVEAEFVRHIGRRVIALRPYGASEPRGVFLADAEEARDVDGLLRVMCGGPAR